MTIGKVFESTMGICKYFKYMFAFQFLKMVKNYGSYRVGFYW